MRELRETGFLWVLVPQTDSRESRERVDRMNRNLYDTDCMTWSPQGRVYQLEYAMESVKQGTCAVGLRTKDSAVVCGMRRSFSKLAGYNDKLIEVDDHVGVSFSGITTDASMICDSLQRQCLQYKFVYDSPIPSERLLKAFSDKTQVNTQQAGKRPYGVGLIVGSFDQTTGPHVFETSPAGTFLEFYGTAFGARSQAAKTLLEKSMDKFLVLETDPKSAEGDAHLTEAVAEALKALVTSVVPDGQFNGEVVHLAVVGKNRPWKIWTREQVQAVIDGHEIKIPEARLGPLDGLTEAEPME